MSAPRAGVVELAVPHLSFCDAAYWPQARALGCALGELLVALPPGVAGDLPADRLAAILKLRASTAATVSALLGFVPGDAATNGRVAPYARCWEALALSPAAGGGAAEERAAGGGAAVAARARRAAGAALLLVCSLQQSARSPSADAAPAAASHALPAFLRLLLAFLAIDIIDPSSSLSIAQSICFDSLTPLEDSASILTSN